MLRKKNKSCKIANAVLPKAGFTLVELLVVISIIALLLSILMPSLGKARDQAKQVVCQSTIKQWGLAFTMYTGENNGNFPIGCADNPAPTDATGGNGLWWIALKPYIKDNKARCCPTATIPMSRAPKYDQYNAWGVIGTTAGTQTWYAGVTAAKGDYGSYGFNNWLYNETPETMTTRWNWKTINVKNGAYRIPMLTEAVWPSIKLSQANMTPPLIPNLWNGASAQIGRALVNRHRGKQTTLYLDLSAKTETLKQLWVMRWSQAWKDDWPPPVWPRWMENFSEPKY